MGIKKFEYKGINFVIQSYSEDDFCNICEINGSSYRIDFVKNKIETWSKMDAEWKEKAKFLNIEEIRYILHVIFKQK